MRIIDRRSWEARVEVNILKIDKDILSTHDKLVYVVLCGHANKNGEAWPSIASIAQSASCSDRQVQRSLTTLEACGLVIRTEQIDAKGVHTSNIYEIYGFDHYHDTQSPGGCPTVTGVATHSRGGGDTQSPLIDEQLQENSSKRTIPLRGSSAPAVPKITEELIPLEDVPDILLPTLRLFLHETARGGITSSELAQLKALEKIHTPTRIQNEILTALNRYRSKGIPPDTLTVGYLWESLKSQNSRRKKAPGAAIVGCSPPGAKANAAEQEAAADMALLIQKYGLDAGKNAEN